ncbi:T-complex protein 1 subunit gamma [Nymphon striatum]|nr:T-complex protein 1 subunit gamma [Nymphon striatum]
MMGSRPQVLVLNKNTKRESGRKVQTENVTAAKTVADVIRTCLGPSSMMKMLMDPMGGIVMTNDGNAILREITVQHPAAKSMIEISRTQDEEVGDGTTSVIILAGEMLSVAYQYLQQQMHPTVIISAYRLALEDIINMLPNMSISVDVSSKDEMFKIVQSCIGTKFMNKWSELACKIAYEAVSTVTLEEDGRREIDIKRYAKIEKVPGGTIEESYVLKGVMLNKDVTHPQMKRRIENPKILLLDCNLEYKKGESQQKVYKYCIVRDCSGCCKKNEDCLIAAMVLGVIAEHSLPLSMAPVLIGLSKKLAKDSKALTKLSLDRTTAAYKLRFGLADTMLAHSSHEVVVEHLASVSLIKVASAPLFEQITGLFDKYNLPWENLMSVLMDSCNVMRGSKTGLEVRLREKASHLLDIDGDSCHHIHNCSKKFCEPFEKAVEKLHTDIYNDFKWSADLMDALKEICMILEVKFTKPDRFLGHRWLSCYDVTLANLRLMDAYLMFYYSFIPKESKPLYHHVVVSIFHSKEASNQSRMRIRVIQEELSRKSLTEDGRKRKNRIVEKLFYKRKQIITILHFYSAVLAMLKQYVCLFELKKPMIHKLYDRQAELFQEFLGLFIKPEELEHKTLKQLKEMDIDKADLLSKKSMFIGFSTEKALQQLDEISAGQFLTKAQTAFKACAGYMQKKLPLTNATLRRLSAIDPTAVGHSLTLLHLKKLPKTFPTVLNMSERQSYDREVHAFQLDCNLPPAYHLDETPVQLDHWWRDVIKMGKYPALTKMAKAIMSCFHGPLVESSFNLMQDILDTRSGRMKIETFNAFQTVKYSITAQKKSSLELFDRQDILRDPVNTTLCNNLQESWKRYKEEKENKRKVIEQKKAAYALKAAKLESKQKSKVAQQLVEKKARMAFIQKRQNNLKRKANLEALTNIEIMQETDFSKLLELEENYIQKICEDIIRAKPDLIFTEKGVSDLAQYYLCKAGITAIRRLRKSDNNRVARACGATIVSRTDEIRPEDIGTGAGLFEIKKIGEEYFCFISECKDPKACTIVLRGANKPILMEVERNLHDAMNVVRNVMLEGKITPGGGAIEMAVAQALNEKAKSITGVHQWPYKAVAKALEIIPRTLIQNCGANTIRVLTALRAKHAQPGNGTWGINGVTGELVDMKEFGIWEPLSVKLQTFKTAIETAILLLRIDDIVSGTKKSSDSDGPSNSAPAPTEESVKDF